MMIMTTAEITATKLDVVNIPKSMPLNSSIIIVCIYFTRKQLVIHIFIYIHMYIHKQTYLGILI